MNTRNIPTENRVVFDYMDRNADTLTKDNPVRRRSRRPSPATGLAR